MAKILVIEDEADVRDSIVDILNAEDFIVDSAANGQDGLTLIAEFRPDLVLCDIMMPILDGYGVLEHLRRQEATKNPAVHLSDRQGRQSRNAHRYESGGKRLSDQALHPRRPAGNDPCPPWGQPGHSRKNPRAARNPEKQH